MEQSAVRSGANHTSTSNTGSSGAISGLDSIRLYSALIVVIGHSAFRFDFTSFGLSIEGSRILNGILGLPWNGPAAVIVFFVLSGFFIHAPYAQGKKFILGEYLARRFIRILIPSAIFVVMYLTILGQPPHNDWNRTVIWSVICEFIYYSIYPVLIYFRVKMLHVFIVATAAYIITIYIYFGYLNIDLNYIALGAGLTWLIGLPVWLLGCMLATNWRQFWLIPLRYLYVFRFAILMIPAVLQIMRFQVSSITPFNSYAISLNIFALLVFIWLGFEIRYQSMRTQKTLIDKLGAATFSIYLVHWFVLDLYTNADRGLFMVISYVVLTAVASLVFYTAVERPSHQLARRVGARMKTFTNKN